MQAAERKFCISCNESIKKGKNSQWRDLGKSLFSTCQLCWAVWQCWAQTPELTPAPAAASQPCTGIAGSGAAGHWDGLGQCPQWWLELVRPLMEGRIFPPLKPPWCRDLLQARFASDCPVPLCLRGPARGMNPRSVTGPGGTALLEKCHLLGCTRAPRAPRPPRLCLLHWARPGCGTLRTPH